MPSPVPSARIDRAARRSALAAVMIFGLGIVPHVLDARSGTPPCPLGSPANEPRMLDRLLACAPDGSRILLGDADFGHVEIRGLRGRRLIVESANPARPARFDGIAIRDSEGLALRSLVLTAKAQPGQNYKLWVHRSAAISIEGLGFLGDAASFLPTISSALMIQASHDVTVRESRIEGYRHGISLMNVDRVTLSRNLLRNLQTDGIRAGGASNILISRNVISSLFPAPEDHPDGIQFWTRNQTETAPGVVIEDNIILRGRGQPAQGIFFRATSPTRFRDVVIRGNLVVGAKFNGIAVMGADNVVISDNTVLPLTTQMSWIRVEDSTGTTLSQNKAGRYVLKGSIAQKGNQTAQPDRDAVNLVRTWRARLDLDATRYPE